MTIDKLMQVCNCTVWPERWREIYDRAMHKYEAEGCLYSKPGYYDGVEAKYHVLGEYLDVFKRAAVAVSENKNLEMLLALISNAMTDHDVIYNDIENFKPPVAPEGEDPFAYNMLIGLASFSMIDYTYNKFYSRNIPSDITQKIISYYINGYRAYKSLHNGEDGYCNYLWQQKIAGGKLLPLKRFNIELGAEMTAQAKIFVNDKGEAVSLAHDITLHKSGFPLGSKYFEDEEGSYTAFVEETEDSYIGYPFLENGYVATEKIALPKKDWTKKLEYGDKVISIHIPGKQKFTPDIVDESLSYAVEFIKEYFPEEMCDVFHCYSWMCDPQLLTLLPETSNLVSFCKRFKSHAAKSQGKDILQFVFHTIEENPDYDALPEDTSFLKTLKNHFKSGKAVYEMTGYFFIK